MRGDIPPGAFRVVGPGILVSSPEFVALQLASELDDIDLIRCCMSLCSCYSLDVSSQNVTQREALTSTEKIEAFLLGCKGHRGIMRIRRALRLVANRAYSPREIETHMLACLPDTLGGYGLPRAMLNYPIQFGSDETGVLDRTNRCRAEIDLFWPCHNVGIEYQGRWHENSICQDMRRLNMLTALGMHVLQADTAMLSDATSFRTLMAQLASLLRCPLPPNSTAWLMRHDSLRRHLQGGGRIQL